MLQIFRKLLARILPAPEFWPEDENRRPGGAPLPPVTAYRKSISERASRE